MTWIYSNIQIECFYYITFSFIAIRQFEKKYNISIWQSVISFLVEHVNKLFSNSHTICNSFYDTKSNKKKSHLRTKFMVVDRKYKQKNYIFIKCFEYYRRREFFSQKYYTHYRHFTSRLHFQNHSWIKMSKDFNKLYFDLNFYLIWSFLLKLWFLRLKKIKKRLFIEKTAL